MIETSILVVGAGAIGGVTAAKMTDQVRWVTVLDANEEHVERMRGDGLLIDDLGEERRITLDAHAGAEGLDGPFDFALITLKAPHLEGALRPLLEGELVNTLVSLGNGLVQERIAGIVGEENLIWGTVEWGSTNLGPGHLARTTRGPFIIGEPDGSVRDRTRLLADALGAVDEALVVAMQQAGATKASMLQDLERGIETEVDVINGVVVEKGREYGVETPLNARVVDLMHAIEGG